MARRDSKVVSSTMKKVCSKDTAPETTFRKALWAKGYRYSLHRKNLPGNPDIVLPAHKTIIFIDGELWHGSQWSRRGFSSLDEQFADVNNKEYWTKKIRRNMERDINNTKTLYDSGWEVLRLWGSDIIQNTEDCVDFVVESLEQKRANLNTKRLSQRTYAEFFAGIGLVGRGLSMHGWTGVYANDIDMKKYEIFESNSSNGIKYYVEDINNLEASSIPEVTLATASFPCTDLSLAGNRGGLNNGQSKAFWSFIKLLDEAGDRRPPLVLLENVPGFLTSHKGKDFYRAIEALNKLGYNCDSFILDASSFVPQSRKRLFVVGVDKGLDAERPLYLEEDEYRPKQLIDFIEGNPELGWRLRKLPKIIASPPPLVEVLEDIPFDSPLWWSSERTEYLVSQMSHRGERAASHLKGRDGLIGTVYRRVRNGKISAELRVDGIAGCLRTPKGGSSKQILLYSYNGQYKARLMTSREYARLQGVDDAFVIDVNENQALFGFGDAVCVPVISWIAEQYLNPLINEKIRSKISANG